MARWIIDPDHSCAAFAIRHFGLAHVRGQFNSIQGTIHYEPADGTLTTVEVEINVAAMTTGNKNRDEHLMTEDFFDLNRYPSIKFKSDCVEFLENNRCRVTGELTLHGTMEKVSLEGEYSGPWGNPFGDETSIGFTGSTTINREEFGMMWGSEAMKGGGLVAGREVLLYLDVEADLAE